MAKKSEKLVPPLSSKPDDLTLCREITEIITNKKMITFAAAVRNNLRVMSAGNSLYFTVGDVCQYIKDEYLKPFPHLQTTEALQNFMYRLAQTMHSIYSGKDHSEGAINRTSRKIAHNNPSSLGPKSFGYRFGAAMAALSVNADTINGQKNHEELFSHVMGGENVLDGLLNAIKTLNFADLIVVNNAANARMRRLFYALEQKYTELHGARTDKIRRLLEELEK